MFNLDREIQKWCRRIAPRFFFYRPHIAELEDHLHCAVAELVRTGMTQEAAFRSVTDSMGEATSLRQEFCKNTGILSILQNRGERYPPSNLNLRFAAICLAVIVTLGLSLRGQEIANWAVKFANCLRNDSAEVVGWGFIGKS